MKWRTFSPRSRTRQPVAMAPRDRPVADDRRTHRGGRPLVVARLCLLAGLMAPAACSAPPPAPSPGSAAVPAGGMFSLAPPERPRPPGNPALDGVVTSSGTNQIIPPGR